jgi:hypothetical protein
MSDAPQVTWKGRLLAFGVSAILCVVLIEGAARLFERKGNDSGAASMQLTLQPYMMFVGNPGKNVFWQNLETGSPIPSTVTFNNLGFNVSDDLSVPPSPAFIGKYAKKPGEKLVLITGGSVVHGVGATANDKTTAALLEATLNARQSRYRYRVINLGMGSWIAYQQFVGLSLFGLPLQPDWIVTMDGHNDGAVSCAHGSGPGNPMGWPLMLYLTGGGSGQTKRGPLLEWLLENTSIARVVTGQNPTTKAPADQRVYFDDHDPDKRFEVKLRGLKIGGLDTQVDFYLLAEQNVKDLFSSSNILFSTQPLLRPAGSPWYRRAFRLDISAEAVAADKQELKAALDEYMAREAETPCDSTMGSPTLGYFMARSAMRLEQKAAEWDAHANGRRIFYANTEMVFPGSYKARVQNFVDSAHLSDAGQKRVGEYFAGYILKADLGMPFDVREFAMSAFAEDTKRSGRVLTSYQYNPPPEPPAKPIAGKRRPEGVKVSERSPGTLQLDEEKGAGYHRVLWSDVPATVGKDNILTVDVWSDTIQSILLEIVDKAETYARADFDLVGDTVIFKNGKGIEPEIRDLGKGWKRVSLSVRLAADTAALSIALLSENDEVLYPGNGRSIVIAEPSFVAKGASH